MLFRVYLRCHEANRVGEIDMASRTVTHNPNAAIIAYRELLARDDLAGQKWAAVLSRATSGSGSALFFSRFDRDFDDGRIKPNDIRLDPMMDYDDAADLRG